MDFTSPNFWLSLLQIVWIDLLLSGDNAIVIALACRSLPKGQRKWGIVLGAAAAVVLRILFALAVSLLLGIPLLKVVGALLLFWIAIKLAVGDDDDGHEVEAADTLFKAVRTIAIADAVMSLDNVVAVAAAARGHAELFVFGLLLTIPLIVFGAQVLLTLLQRLPVLIWAGAALLGWIAGDMLVRDTLSVDLLAHLNPALVVENHDGLHPAALPHYVASGLGAAFVVAVGLVMRRRAAVGGEA
ncbi:MULTISPECIES: TerC family protein [unclassified Xanthobacter]|uniref:TerC family protein n=1 Tax=unclassified Xanthobacter TaxID=2623496 RepID=UPI001F3B8E0C|nr:MULTISPECIES: TerC family protein [unclassified Xanthobacter]